MSVISNLLGYDPYSFAYPYGKVTRPVLAEVSSSDYQMGLTVDRKSNGFFAHPYLLGRSMVFNEHTLDDFAELLIVYEAF